MALAGWRLEAQIDLSSLMPIAQNGSTDLQISAWFRQQSVGGASCTVGNGVALVVLLRLATARGFVNK